MTKKRILKEKPSKLAIIAGEGSLPRHVYDQAVRDGVVCTVIGLENQTSLSLFQGVEVEEFPIHAVSRILKAIKSKGIEHVVLAGKVKRANISRLLLDVKGAKLFARILKHGLSDDNLLTTILAFLEDEGFKIVAPDQIATNLLSTTGCMTKTQVDEEARDDIKKGLKILKGISEYDVGQALVIQSGLVLGVEAAEGTDQLIERCGSIQQKDGTQPILVKVLKINQDKRVDFPCIGADTIQKMHEFNIRGVAIEAAHSYILDKEEAIELADKYKIFIYGF